MKRLILTGQEARDAAAGALTEVRRPIVNPPMLWDSWDSLGAVTCSRRRSYIWVGDLLWGAETWAPMSKQVRLTRIAYRADMTIQNQQRAWKRCGKAPWPVDNARGRGYAVARWRSAATMPQWASRVTLRLTAVRAEKVDGVWTWIGTVEPAGGVK